MTDIRTRALAVCGIIEHMYLNNKERLSNAELGALPWACGYLQGINDISDDDVDIASDDAALVSPRPTKVSIDDARKAICMADVTIAERDFLAWALAWKRANHDQ